MATGLGAIVVAIVVVSWMAMRIDIVTQDKSIVLIESALEAQKAQISAISREYGYWDAAYEWFMARDDRALYENLGTNAVVDGKFDELFLVAADGTPQYAYANGLDTSDTSTYPKRIGDFLLNDVRTLPAEPYQSVDCFVIIDGVLTVFVAARLQPTDAADVDPTTWPMLVGVRSLNNRALNQLGAQLMLHNLAMIDSGAPVPDGKSSAVLSGIHNESIGQVIWDIEEPGAKLVRQTAPLLTVIAGLVVLISLSVARAFSKQTDTYIAEHTNARTDVLTGLLNRVGLDDLVNSPDIQGALENGRLAVIYADLNNFKMLNDTHGHEAGDEALRITANRLRDAVRGKDQVARVGGDEFVCVLSANKPSTYVHSVVRRMQSITNETISIKGELFHVPAAIGYAVSEAGDDWDNLLARADKAMFAAKKSSQKSLKSA